MTPVLSVIVRVYNAERHLREAVDSALSQEGVNFEVVVVDDGSTDASPRILAEYADPRLRVVRQENAGKIPAAIRGLNEARGRYVAILDADDRALPGRFAAQVSFLNLNPDVVLVGSALGIIDQNGARVGLRRYPLDDRALRRAATIYNPFAHSAITYRRAAALEAGGYTTRNVVEDYDLNLRLMGLGRAANLPEVYAEYRINTDAVNGRLVKVVLRSTIATRATAHRLYGFPRTLKSSLVDLSQRALCLAPAVLVNWLCHRTFYRHA